MKNRGIAITFLSRYFNIDLLYNNELKRGRGRAAEEVILCSENIIINDSECCLIEK